MVNMINVHLTFKPSGIKKSMQKAVAEELNRILHRNFLKIYNTSYKIIEDVIHDSPTYQSLIVGDPFSLEAELGIVNSESKLLTIIRTWQNSLRISIQDVKFSGNRLIGGMRLYCIDSSYRDVLSLPEASYTDIRKKNNEIYTIPWLEWLLIRGVDPLIYYFYVDTDIPETYQSRTGLAVMKYSISEVYRIPDEHAGTEDDNWITKAMEQAAIRIQEVIQEVIV